MGKRSYFTLVVLAALAAFVARKEMRTPAGAVILLFALVAALSLYLMGRDRSKPPTAGERTLATIWLWLRRTLAFSLGGACLFGGGYIAFFTRASKDFENPVLSGVVLALFGTGIIYMGVFGQGADRFDFRDDLRLHSENKRRYRWWF
jgi:hypothetical protein